MADETNGDETNGQAAEPTEVLLTLSAEGEIKMQWSGPRSADRVTLLGMLAYGHAMVLAATPPGRRSPLVLPNGPLPQRG